MSQENVELDVEEFIDGGQYVVVPLVLRARMVGSGEEVALPKTDVWRVRSGKVIEVCEYRTRQQALKALGLPE